VGVQGDGLTVLGAGGWEMVAVDPPIVNPNLGPTYIFKRLKRP
jgi:hypothetical protein